MDLLTGNLSGSIAGTKMTSAKSPFLLRLKRIFGRIVFEYCSVCVIYNKKDGDKFLTTNITQ